MYNGKRNEVHVETSWTTDTNIKLDNRKFKHPKITSIDL